MKKITKATAALILFLVVGAIIGCTPESGVMVTTYKPQDITCTTAVCGGDAVVIAGLSLTEIGVCWSLDKNPTVQDAHLSTTDWDQPFVCTIQGLNPGTVYYIRAYALRGLEYYYGKEQVFTTEGDNGCGIYNGHEYVDLGLHSGTLWATCNLGASKPTDFGDYYAWGESRTKDLYNWETYKYYLCEGDSNCGLIKYCSFSNSLDYGLNGFFDNIFNLQPIDDAATVEWGEGWCMPTKEQWDELWSSTTVTWTIRNGVGGRLFTATNGNTLFLPAAGCFDDYYGHSYDETVGAVGHYWSNSLDTHESEGAYFFRFGSESWHITPENRYAGRSVRPVRSTSKN